MNAKLIYPARFKIKNGYIDCDDVLDIRIDIVHASGVTRAQYVVNMTKEEIIFQGEVYIIHFDKYLKENS